MNATNESGDKAWRSLTAGVAVHAAPGKHSVFRFFFRFFFFVFLDELTFVCISLPWNVFSLDLWGPLERAKDEETSSSISWGRDCEKHKLHAIRPTLVADALQFYHRFSRYMMELLWRDAFVGKCLFRWSIVPIRDETANEGRFLLVIGSPREAVTW